MELDRPEAGECLPSDGGTQGMTGSDCRCGRGYRDLEKQVTRLESKVNVMRREIRASDRNLPGRVGVEVRKIRAEASQFRFSILEGVALGAVGAVFLYGLIGLVE